MNEEWDDDCTVMCVIGYLAGFILIMAIFAAVLWLA
jgi:hypothetical protein